MNDLFYSLGDFFVWTFKLLPALGNLPNFLFIAVITGYFLYWLSQMKKHSRAGEL